MITKIVWEGNASTCTYAGDNYYGEASEETYYAVGWRKPNYPVPTRLADVTCWVGNDNPFCAGTELIIWKHAISKRTREATRVVSAIFVPE